MENLFPPINNKGGSYPPLYAFIVRPFKLMFSKLDDYRALLSCGISV